MENASDVNYIVGPVLKGFCSCGPGMREVPDGIRPSTLIQAMTGSALETDTIAAISTPPGRGGIGIVRLSGPLAKTIGGATGATAPTAGACAGAARRCARCDADAEDDGARIDEAVVTYFAGAQFLHSRRPGRDRGAWVAGGARSSAPACHRPRRAAGRAGRVHPARLSCRAGSI